ncbi:MAG: ATP-binding protein, partial [Candidatus Omnitrophica bacterium]|nr:ATP-binding protein [Candidatus Omnitrophota bacterium]
MSQAIDLRPSLTAYLHQRLLAFQDGFRHNLALLGPLGSGKSVLLQQVLGTSGARVATIYCSLQRDPVRTFLRGFMTAVLRGALDDASSASLEELLAHSTSRLPRTTAAIQQLERYVTGHIQAEAFGHVFDLIPIVQQELQRPCVLVLDEFLHLDELGVSHVFHELGKRVMTWPHTLFLLSSSSTCRARAILRERLHLLFGQFEIVSVGPMETAATMAWMQHEFPQVEPDAAPLRFALHWVGASPWYLGVLLKRMKELLLLKREDRLTESLMCEAAWDVLGSSDGVLYQWCAVQVERIIQERLGPLAREALGHVASGARTTQDLATRCGTRRHLSEALQMLVEHDLIQRKGACWVIPDQLFACWLSAVLASRQGGGISGGQEDTAQRFERILRASWAQWLQASAEPLADRIGQLFSSFRNETVSLDHKTGRLPCFQVVRGQRSLDRQETYLVA